MPTELPDPDRRRWSSSAASASPATASAARSAIPGSIWRWGAEPFVECPYCDRRFVLAAGSEGEEDERLAPGVYEGAGGH